jgi:hypothetical protein
MKRKIEFLSAATILFSLVLACSSPYHIAIMPAKSATPDTTMTALFALATLLTPEKSTATSTVTPPPPTLTATLTSTATIPPTATTTNTASPTATFTSIPYVAPVYVTPYAYRPGGTYYASYFSPSLDGNWGEWGSHVYSSGAIIYGAGNWTGKKDLDSSFRVSWDDSYLYIAVKVIDDIYSQNATGGELYKGDTVEILFDANLYGDGYYTALSSDDFQLVLSPGLGDVHGSKEAVLYYPRSRSGTKNTVEISSSYSPNSPEGTNHYYLEAAIPWGVIGVSNPESGDAYGFLLSTSDNDNTSENVQQTMSSSYAGRKFLNPTTWGTLILN